MPRSTLWLALGLAACGGSVGTPGTTGTTAPVTTTAAVTTTSEPAQQTPDPAPPPPARRTFTIAASGEILIHEAISNAAAAHASGDGYDFVPLLAQVEPWIASADLAICHLEGTLSPDNTGLLYQIGHTHPAYFNGPHEVADALAAVGYDACSTASNHALDRGTAGVVETLDVLEAAGLGHAGTARTSAEALRPATYEAGGVVVAHLSYTSTINRPFESRDRSWEVNVLDVGKILEEAGRARAAGAEFVIVSLHWGASYQSLPTGAQVTQARTLLSSPDVDLLIGHAAHVIQPIDWVDGKPVVYGLGNQLSNIRGLADGTKTGGEDGMIVHISVIEGEEGFRVRNIEITPTWVTPASKEVLPVAHVLATGDGSYRRSLQVSWDRTLARALRYLPDHVSPSPTPWVPYDERPPPGGPARARVAE